MSFEPDSTTHEEKVIMLLREILNELKLINLVNEELHASGLDTEDIERG
jgi:hypothetical protein